MEEKSRQQELPEYAHTINRECLFEYDFADSDIIRIAREGSNQEKMLLFGKIMENATDILKSLRIFSPEDQRDLLFKYRVPDFRRNFLERRYKILRYFLTGQQVDIPELQWNE